MVEKVGFFIQQDIESDLVKKNTQIEYYSEDVSYLMSGTGKIMKYKYNNVLSRIYSIAQRCEELPTNSLLRKFLMSVLKHKVINYLENNIISNNSAIQFYTVNRNGRIVEMKINNPIIVNVKNGGQVYVDFQHKLSQYETEIISVELRRVFNAYYKVNDYLSWYLKRREDAFRNVLRDDCICYGLLMSPNLNVLIDFDSKARLTEFSPKWDEFLTYEDDVRRFLAEAEENIPRILEKNKEIQENDKYYQILGEKVFNCCNDMK